MNVVADFRVDYKAEMDRKLDAAVEAAHINAVAAGACGVLVTRHEFGHFTVALSPDIPFGITREHDQVCR